MGVIAEDLEALNFKIPATLKQRLRRYGQSNGLTMSAAIRLLLTKALNHEEWSTRPS